MLFFKIHGYHLLLNNYGKRASVIFARHLQFPDVLNFSDIVYHVSNKGIEIRI